MLKFFVFVLQNCCVTGETIRDHSDLKKESTNRGFLSTNWVFQKNENEETKPALAILLPNIKRIKLYFMLRLVRNFLELRIEVMFYVKQIVVFACFCTLNERNQE